MQKNITLRLSPEESGNSDLIVQQIAANEAIDASAITGFFCLKKSLDARSRQIWVNLTLSVSINEPFINRPLTPFHFKEVYKATKKAVIIGAGPAGLFAALKLLEKGVKPIILERGKDVSSRRRDLAALNKQGIINENSNYCFGEGGAGTYSDGKLYTRSKKRGDIDRILQLFVHFGAEEKILYESHPHIGTNKLPQIIAKIREQILHLGGEIHFEQQVVDFEVINNSIASVTTANGDKFIGDSYILATGHSARDIFELLYQQKILIEAKPFALGVRIEHPQELINQIQYHRTTLDNILPPAAYSLVEQVEGKGVFSFCMCPGGIIAPAATSAGELVVNGWSPSKRNNPFANSGLVVQVDEQEAMQTFRNKQFYNGEIPNEKDPLLLMKFQKLIETISFNAGGGNFKAPAQRVSDFVTNKVSANLPICSYHPGTVSSNLHQILPPFISETLKTGLIAFGKKMKGYVTNEAIMVATESRTSSPVRIPRDPELLSHPQIKNLYPCGEGAGYAGGIVSAAIDGERVAEKIGSFNNKL